MPTYDYYSEETGEIKEVFHGMMEEPQITCLVCNSVMWRIPQPMTFYRKPFDVLYEHHDKKFAEIMARDKKFNNRNHEGVIR